MFHHGCQTRPQQEEEQEQDHPARCRSQTHAPIGWAGSALLRVSQRSPAGCLALHASEPVRHSLTAERQGSVEIVDVPCSVLLLQIVACFWSLWATRTLLASTVALATRGPMRIVRRGTALMPIVISHANHMQACAAHHVYLVSMSHYFLWHCLLSVLAPYFVT